MKRLILLAFLHTLAYMALGQVHVNGYYRSNGTYVQPHYRSSPDGNPYNNWSYPGNVNPYTGKVAGGNNGSTGNTGVRTSGTGTTSTGVTGAGTSNGVRAYASRRLNVLSSITSRANLSIVATLDEKAEVIVLNRNSDPWYYVQFDYYDPEVRYTRRGYGYIHSDYLSGATTAQPETTAPSITTSFTEDSYVGSPHTTSKGRQYYVTTASLDVHAATNASSKVVTQLTFKDLATVVSTRNDPWYQVQVTYLEDGRMHSTTAAYVYAGDLSRKCPKFVQNSSEELTSAPASHPTAVQTLQPPSPPTPTSTQTSNSHPFGEHNGKINFWSNVPREDISVYIDHVYAGQLTTFFSEQPTLCGSPGSISVVKPAGTYLVQAIGQWFHFSGQVTVAADDCINTRIGAP